jgi:hypothetical protein
MLYFIIYSTFLVLMNSMYSLRNYNKFNYVYKNLNYWNFSKFGKLQIANNNTKDEFVMISDWNYRISPNINLQFDIWTLLDIHQMIWICKFNNKLKNSNKFD